MEKMNRKLNIKKIVFAAIGIMVIGFSAIAQDTTKKRMVDITSTFKPVLREASKINFSATPPVSDTSKPRLQYDIPNQNLLFAYQPGTLKPLALGIDTGGRWDNSSYVKIGFGSLRTPLIQAGISFGDGKTAGLNIYAKHVASEGKRDFQDFSKTDVTLNAFFQSGNNLEWNARLGMNNEKTYKYGYIPETMVFLKDSLSQKFQTYSGRLGLHNINLTEFGLSYQPEIKIDVFSDNLKNNESNTVINLPLQKTIGRTFAATLGLTFDLTRFSPDQKSAINNTMYFISPSVLFKTPNVNIEAGIRPSWDNKTFKLFPNILAEFSSPDKRFTFQAGWTGYVRKTTYQYLASLNPWLWVPSSFKNTWIEERYAGFKGSVGDHFTYSTKVGFHKYSNQPLFINDTSQAGDGKSFVVLNESQMKVLHFGVEAGYTMQEKFSLITGLTFNQYNSFQLQKKAWGLIPVELKAAMRLQVLKDLWVKSDLFAWQGPLYMKKDGSSDRLSGAFDLNAGVEFRILPNLNLWTQFNNIFNKEYQRWNQYPVYGFNFVGGIVFSFNQKH
ncbi:MAG: TonB-dependent receptor [Bacteroidota bacterium]|nr:TonB-dependent receptor [Bacteroidota bacterium]